MVEELERLVERACAGDLDAYGQIVGRFQDMAYGCAYAVVGDFHLAQDVAQVAFLEAYRSLDKLQDAQAFPGWFRRIVLHSCNRLTRRRQPDVVGMETLADVAATSPEPAKEAGVQEMKDKVLAAIRALPEHERMVTTLFYINGYSQEEIAGFLEVPVTTVKNRLHTSRGRLKERMMNMVADEMKSHPLPEQFPKRIRLLLELPRPLEIEGHPVKEIWDSFRSCFPRFEVLKLEEVIARDTCLCQTDEDVGNAYPIDKRRLLRTALTSQLVRRWQHQGGGLCQLMTAGRVFRQGQNVGPTNLEVHHQAEILWSGHGLDERLCMETALKTASILLAGIECRRGEACSYTPVPKASYYEAKWKGSWLNVGVGGMVEGAWLSKLGLDPQRDGAISICFGLDRCAQVRHGLDDIRKLWQPPHVPKKR